MYYPQPSPGIARELANHRDQTSWSRSHHPVLGPPANQQNVGPPPTSPGYGLYSNGAIQPHLHHQPIQQQQQIHHHQNSLSHYSSPTNGHAQHQHVLQGSPASVPGQVIAPHWQNQLLKCDVVRSSRSPHHRARASAMSSRTVTKSAIPITNPNSIKPPPEVLNGTAPAKEEVLSPTSANHPSSTVAPVAAPRPTAPRPPQNNWTSLDMGGINIKNLPPTSGLFSFTFLTNLYLNHNALSVIPSAIQKLRQLELLDLSGNNLTTLPPEIGMLTELKELYLFDNHLTSIPPELGTLHQLQTLGVEGNPLEATLKNIITKDGTPALISFLRDSCPVPLPPPERVWKSLLTPAERELLSNPPPTSSASGSAPSVEPPETCSVLSYNILAEFYATERLYGYTPSWALLWDYRKELILNEILTFDSDFICLQEVEIAQYEGYFTGHLAANGYEGVYWPKSRYKTMSESDRRHVDGCATFYKSAKFKLVEQHTIEFSAAAMQRQDFKKTDDMFNRVLGKDHIAVICLLENRETGTRFVLANTHIHWDPAYCDVKLVQAALLVEEIEKCADSFAAYPPPRLSPSSSSQPSADGADDASATLPSPTTESSSLAPQQRQRQAPTYTDGTKIPIIICVDLNSVPSSGVYEFLSTGSLPPNHSDFLSHVYGKYTSEGLRHRLGLKSAYAGSSAGPAGELPMTNYTPSFQGVLDYVWFSAANLGVNAVLGEVDKSYLEKVVGFPNAHFPSDHICIVTEFRVKPPRDTLRSASSGFS